MNNPPSSLSPWSRSCGRFAPGLRVTPPATRQGFTLVELLTVIVIIGILAALLIPITGRMRATAERSACLSNLRQIQMANILHAADNRGYYIRVKENDVWWMVQEKFIHYINAGKRTQHQAHSLLDELKCPSAKALLEKLSSTWESQNFAGYAYRSYGVSVESPGNFKALNHNNVPNPAKIMAFADGLDFHFNKPPPASYDWTDEKKIAVSMSYRHRNGSNVVYFDGHVEHLSRDQIEPKEEHPNLWGSGY